MQKIALLAFFAVLALTLSRGVSGQRTMKSFDLRVGDRIYGDYLLEQEVDKGGFPFRKTEKTVTIKGDGTAKITSVEVFDLMVDGHGARPSIVTGGPGYSFVTIDFHSQRGHGIHSLVKIYAK